MRIIEEPSCKNIYISLNYYCNNNCLMCGVPFEKHNKYKEELQFYINELKKVPFQIKHNDIITLSGGEPFLFKDIWELLNYIKEQYDCRITIFTNGRALKEYDIVKKIKLLGVNKLVIPFFSYKKDVYNLIAGANAAYEEVIAALNNLSQEDIYYELKYLPMKQNAEDIKESYLFVKKNYPKAVFTICGVQYFGESVKNVFLIGIKYKDLKEELETTFDIAREKYNEIIPLYRFPMCILDAQYSVNGVLTLFQEFIIGPDYSDVNVSDNNRKKFRIPAECIYCKCSCDWYSKNYEQIFGTDELKRI